MAEPPDPMSKIRSAALRERTERADPERSVVVIEVGVPPQSKVTRQDVERARPLAFELPGDDDGALLDEVRREVERIGATVVNAFRSSSALVVEASAGQLQRIARLSAVVSIWPNDRGEN
jgi:hypothetical protein